MKLTSLITLALLFTNPAWSSSGVDEFVIDSTTKHFVMEVPSKDGATVQFLSCQGQATESGGVTINHCANAFGDGKRFPISMLDFYPVAVQKTGAVVKGVAEVAGAVILAAWIEGLALSSGFGLAAGGGALITVGFVDALNPFYTWDKADVSAMVDQQTLVNNNLAPITFGFESEDDRYGFLRKVADLLNTDPPTAPEGFSLKDYYMKPYIDSLGHEPDNMPANLY